MILIQHTKKLTHQLHRIVEYAAFIKKILYRLFLYFSYSFSKVFLEVGVGMGLFWQCKDT